jgi:hypothetical protein
VFFKKIRLINWKAAFKGRVVESSFSYWTRSGDEGCVLGIFLESGLPMLSLLKVLLLPAIYFLTLLFNMIYLVSAALFTNMLIDWHRWFDERKAAYPVMYLLSYLSILALSFRVEIVSAISVAHLLLDCLLIAMASWPSSAILVRWNALMFSYFMRSFLNIVILLVVFHTVERQDRNLACVFYKMSNSFAC